MARRNVAAEVIGTGVLGLVIVGAIVAAVAGIWLGEAWLADAVYSNSFETRGSSAPNIDYWPMVGLVIIVNLVLGALGRSAKS